MKKNIEIAIEEKLRQKLLRLPEFVMDFFRSIEDTKQLQTRFEYAKDLLMFFEFLLSSNKCDRDDAIALQPIDLDKLEENDFRDFFDHLKSYTLTYATKNKVVSRIVTNENGSRSRKLATLRQFFSYLFKKKLISRDVTPNIEISVKKKATINDRLTPDEMTRFFQTIMDDIEVKGDHQMAYHEKLRMRDYIMSLLLAYTGIRVSELIQLDVSDIYLQKEQIKVIRKGGKEELITLPSRIVEDISDYIEDRKRQENLSKGHENALFLSLQKKRIDARTVRQMLEKYRKRSKIDTKITPHVFRRTFGTNHYNTYEDMYLTAQVLGHTSAETTRKFYADPDQARVDWSMQKFDYEKKDIQSSDKYSKLAAKLGISVEELLKELQD
ncbi:tyrosine-type recombinase/integrase [Brevibacillus sp. NPDC003359]|uniref:tyrosine-type recombinase/integrase n=1 Tax=unclassified Brevibacillus TaxID=2684853 RepID=UPI0036864B10